LLLILGVRNGNNEPLPHFANKFKLLQKLLIFEAPRWRVQLRFGSAKIELVQIHFGT